jgi:hypothetical protein
VTRYSYTDNAGVTHVESVLVEGLAHAFPIRPGVFRPVGNPATMWFQLVSARRRRSRASGAERRQLTVTEVYPADWPGVRRSESVFLLSRGVEGARWVQQTRDS